MAPSQLTARTLEREKKVKSVCAFASSLADRFNASRDTTLVDDLRAQIWILPLQASSAVAAKQDELDKLGTELWNLSTHLRRDGAQPKDKNKEEMTRKDRALCLLRVFSFLLLDSASWQGTKGHERKSCIRLMKVALKAAKVCIEGKEVEGATKVLERAAEYQELLSQEANRDGDSEAELGERLRIEYFALRTALAWRSDRMDTAEHMFTKCGQLTSFLTPSIAENLADLLYEIGKDLLGKRNYEVAIRWLERAHDVLGEQNLEMLSAEAGELRLSIMQSIVQAYMKLNRPEARTKAWHMVKLLEADYEDKMSVSLLKLELLFTESVVDSDQVYLVLHRMIRSVVLNNPNFKTIMHHIHTLKDQNNITACKLIDELIETRLFREEKESWIKKAVITRVWICCTTVITEGVLNQVRNLFDMVIQNVKAPFSAQATHAAQTLLWKQVEATFSQGQYQEAEAWCQVCLHSLFGKAGEINKSKIARKMILCALTRHDYAAARDTFSKMSETGREDCVTRYLMYKVGLHGNDAEFAAECLDAICRQSSKDTTLLYACVMEAQQSGNKKQGILALEKMLEKYNYSAPAEVHLPALLRMTTRLLISELVKDNVLDVEVFQQVCRTFEAGSTQAKASRRRPSNPGREQFNADEFEWFSKNAYNLAIKYCAQVHPKNLVQLLSACIEFIKLLGECDGSKNDDDLCLRLIFCNYLSTCAFVTLARAEDSKQDCMQYYLQASKHGREFRNLETNLIDKLGESSKADIIAKHFQIVKLELEAALKREQWDELDELFNQCWEHGGPKHYETLADLVLIIYSCMAKANVDSKYQSRVLSTLQKIINMSWRQTGSDIVKMARWIRCLFQLSLTYDENVSLKCVEHATQVASSRKGAPLLHADYVPNTPPPTSSPMPPSCFDVVAMTDDHDKEPNHYPATELEWLATTSFNHAVDYYVQENDAKCKIWAEKALALAGWAEDGNELRSMLMEKYNGLAWGDEE